MSMKHRPTVITDPYQMILWLNNCATHDSCDRCPYEDYEKENEETGFPQGCVCIEMMMLDAKDIIKKLRKDNSKWEDKYERLKRGLEQ